MIFSDALMAVHTISRKLDGKAIWEASSNCSNCTTSLYKEST